MKKTLEIDGREVTFKINGAFPIVYKNQFQKDILMEIMPIISELLKGMDEIFEGKDDFTPSSLGYLLENVYSLELTTIINIIWTMAYLEDKSIKEVEKWLEEFNEFPVFDIAAELAPMLLTSLVSKKKLEILRNQRS